jgi:type III restriction enzyme
MLRTALTTRYSHYARRVRALGARWDRRAASLHRGVPEHSHFQAGLRLDRGFERGDAAESERAAFHVGHLELFRNYDDQGGRLPRPRTLLIDSRQIEAGDALDKGFRDAPGPEIEQSSASWRRARELALGRAKPVRARCCAK